MTPVTTLLSTFLLAAIVRCDYGNVPHYNPKPYPFSHNDNYKPTLNTATPTPVTPTLAVPSASKSGLPPPPIDAATTTSDPFPTPSAFLSTSPAATTSIPPYEEDDCEDEDETTSLLASTSVSTTSAAASSVPLNTVPSVSYPPSVSFPPTASLNVSVSLPTAPRPSLSFPTGDPSISKPSFNSTPIGTATPSSIAATGISGNPSVKPSGSVPSGTVPTSAGVKPTGYDPSAGTSKPYSLPSSIWSLKSYPTLVPSGSASRSFDPSGLASTKTLGTGTAVGTGIKPPYPTVSQGTVKSYSFRTGSATGTDPSKPPYPTTFKPTGTAKSYPIPSGSGKPSFSLSFPPGNITIPSIIPTGTASRAPFLSTDPSARASTISLNSTYSIKATNTVRPPKSYGIPTYQPKPSVKGTGSLKPPVSANRTLSFPTAIEPTDPAGKPSINTTVILPTATGKTVTEKPYPVSSANTTLTLPTATGKTVTVKPFPVTNTSLSVLPTATGSISGIGITTDDLITLTIRSTFTSRISTPSASISILSNSTIAPSGLASTATSSSSSSKPTTTTSSFRRPFHYNPLTPIRPQPPRPSTTISTPSASALPSTFLTLTRIVTPIPLSSSLSAAGGTGTGTGDPYTSLTKIIDTFPPFPLPTTSINGTSASSIETGVIGTAVATTLPTTAPAKTTSQGVKPTRKPTVRPYVNELPSYELPSYEPPRA